MFAFAFWDKIEKKLIIARDRVGQKPIYYGYLNNNSPAECLNKGREMSSKIIQQIGARL